MADQKNNLLRKLRALAERGEPGERENARAILAGLMAKYGVEEADLQDDALDEQQKRPELVFILSFDQKRHLFIQCVK